MDKVVSVNRSFLNRIRGFLNIFASNCHGCLVKENRGCLGCDSLIAKVLMHEIDNLRDAKEERYYIENPNDEIKDRILRAFEQAGKPISSRCIILDGVSKQIKLKLLRTMCDEGILTRTPSKSSNERYIYSLNKNTNKKETH